VADRYFVNGGVDNNWGTTGNWSTTSGGAGGSSVPTAADAVFFDANSPNCTVNASNRVALSLDFTGYTNTITMTFNITVSGSVTLASGMTISGSGALIVNATSTLTSNGKTWPCPLNLQSSVTYTLGDDWTVSGLVTLGSGSAAVTLNSNILTCSGGVTIGSSSGSISGTTKLKITGGTFTATGHTNGSIGNNIDFDGSFTFASGTLLRIGGSATVTHVSGTITFAGTHTLTLAGSCTFDTDPIEWKDLTFATALTLTLTSSLLCSGTLLLTGGSVTQTINGGSVCTSGSFSYNPSGSLVIAGTGEICMTGTGTISQAGGSSIPSFPLVIDTVGDITISSAARWDLSKFAVRNARSITTTEAWNLGSGGSLNPLTSIFGKV
jgi:hypothetical protein